MKSKTNEKASNRTNPFVTSVFLGTPSNNGKRLFVPTFNLLTG